MNERAIEPLTPYGDMPAADQANDVLHTNGALPDPPANAALTPIQELPAARFDLLPKTPMPPAGHKPSEALHNVAGLRDDDAHKLDAGQDESAPLDVRAGTVEPSKNGHASTEAQPACADLERLHALLGHYARQYFDVQKLRVAQSNRLDAMERDGLGGVWTAPAQNTTDGLEALEKAIDQQLTRLAKQHPLASWIQDQRGIGLPTMARLLGITGPLSRFGTVSKLWAYLGMHVVDGSAPKRKKGERANWSPQGRVLCYLMGEAIVKVGKGGPYRAAYDRKKAEYESDRPDWTQARRHNAAMRYAVKLLLKEAWLEWRRAVS